LQMLTTLPFFYKKFKKLFVSTDLSAQPKAQAATAA